MSQDPNMYNTQYPPQHPGGFGAYPPQQPGGFGAYPPQQPGAYGAYPPQQPEGYAPYPPQAGGAYGQNQMPFQPPPVVPRPDLPKDDEQVGGQWGDFSGLGNKEIRRVFIRKVYFILMIQLLITFGIIALFHFTPAIRAYVQHPEGRWLYWTSYGVFLVTYLVLICSKSAARRFPFNLILLALLTIAMGYMMGMISAMYTIDSVLVAVGITVVVCLGVTLFSFQTKYDFTSCFGVMFVISIALLGFGIVAIFSRSPIMYTVYAGLGAVAFSIFLAVDTQLIMGGKRHEISAEDHIFASLMLYIDIVYIFIFILSLLGNRE
jgi:FtsH-binding integral membrane protein